MDESRMAPQVDETMTLRAASLARIRLSEEELREFTPQLGRILGYVAQLQEVEVEGVEPLAHPFPQESPLREDVVREPPRDAEGRPLTLVAAPETDSGGFKVPPIL
jgi:aspartyl-tRNA(Asn)/glutamyl-tRNA(Gln) amidotransferase subunit C